MKRREFIFTSVIGLAGLVVAKGSLAGLVWAKPGALGYKESAPSGSTKSCSNCGWFQKDTQTRDGGMCKFAGIQVAAKSKVVYVKSSGICNMWKKG